MRDTIILLSGGMASFEASIRIIKKKRYGVRLWFFDTLIEDEDLYRFLNDIGYFLNVNIEYYCDGRNPWQVFRDERYIGNTRADVCSRVLKRELLTKELKKQYPNGNVNLVFGVDWTEMHRIKPINDNWNALGVTTSFPLVESPYFLYKDYRKSLEEKEIKVPRLYSLGFSHNNCGGACVKAGITQWLKVLEYFPLRYKWHEEMEQALRKDLKKDISILRNRRNNKTRSMTLKYLRWRNIESSGTIKKQFDTMELIDEACGCFIPMYNESLIE
ncbi:MAG: hypothetical protein ABSB78_14130 [Bacteroidota bacterium]